MGVDARWHIEPTSSRPDGTWYVISPDDKPLGVVDGDRDHKLIVFPDMTSAGRVCDLLNKVAPECGS